MLKNEFAKRAGIPVSTLRNYMNKLLFEKLLVLNYSRNQKYLTPRQVAFLNRELDVTTEP